MAALLAILASRSNASAQTAAPRRWNDPRTLELVARAISRRSAQLADSGLADYHAVAHGSLTFFAQLGEGFPDPPQVVRADELAVEVYWRAPNLSKQRVIGRRDTLLLPTDINYHRDHLGIVQNNFPAIIRLGEGDEVRDVPHPLSVAGRDEYEFATADSLRLRVGARTWDVVMVEVRPRNDHAARVVGAIYLDRETASVVRLNLTFTRAALIDTALEDVSITLDNGLVDGRFWLPRRQEIEIRRTGTWLDFPARGIIRGEWDLCCVEANQGTPPAMFVGPEIVMSPPSVLSAYKFEGTLRDSIASRVDRAGPDRPAAQLQERAGELVRTEALRRAEAAALSAPGVSDFVRANRVEGLSTGLGGSLRMPADFSVRGSARYGWDDRLLKHTLSLAWKPGASETGVRVTLAAFDEYRDAAIVPEASRMGNSVAAEDFGVDYTDEYRVHGVSLTAAGGGAVRWTLGAERLSESPLAVHATPYSGTFRPALDADGFSGFRARLQASAPRLAQFGGARLSAAFTASAGWAEGPTVSLGRGSAPIRVQPYQGPATFGRASLDVDAERAAGPGTLMLTAIAAAASDPDAPKQDQVLFGGPVTGPGYEAHSLRAESGVSLRAEWRVPIGSFTIPLGRFGRTTVPLILAPFGQWVSLSGSVPSNAAATARSAGIGFITLHELIRLDVARGFDAGGHWVFYADFGHAFWKVL